MESTKLIKYFILAAVFVHLSACKLQVVSTTGGMITSTANGNCPAGAVCTIDITDPAFSEAFTAVPAPGYQFLRWQGGPGFICANSTSHVCTLALPSDYGDDIISLVETVSIMPIYQHLDYDLDKDGVRDGLDDDIDGDGLANTDDPCPIDGKSNYLCITSRSVEIEGKIWALPYLFADVPWSDLDAACPQGVCGDDAEINGYSLRGWHWANDEDVSELFQRTGLSRRPIQNYTNAGNELYNETVLSANSNFLSFLFHFGAKNDVECADFGPRPCSLFLEGWTHGQPLETNGRRYKGVYYKEALTERTDDELVYDYELDRTLYSHRGVEPGDTWAHEEWTHVPGPLKNIWQDALPCDLDALGPNDERVCPQGGNPGVFYLRKSELVLEELGFEWTSGGEVVGPSGLSYETRGAWLYRPAAELNGVAAP